MFFTEIEFEDPPKKKKINYKLLLIWLAFFTTLIAVYAVPLYLMHKFTTKLTGVQYGTVGTIGDAFGMVAPFINLISAVFVYLAFRQQLVANALLQRQIDETKTDEIFRKQYETLQLYINKIESWDHNHIEIYGYDAVDEIIATVVINNCPNDSKVDKEFGEEVYEVCSLINGIERYKQKHKVSDQENLFTGILYKATVRKFIMSIGKGYKRIIDKSDCNRCNGKHKLPEQYYSFLKKNAPHFTALKDIIRENEYMQEFVEMPVISKKHK